MQEIAPGIFAIPGLRTGRAYLIEDRDGLTLVDSSARGVADRIMHAITTLDRDPSTLHTIVATHYHHDHTGNVAMLGEWTGAKLFVHEHDAPYVDGRTPWRQLDGALAGLVGRWTPAPFTLRVDRELRDGDILPAAGGLRVIHAPGHTPGHIALHAADRRVLFAGDAFMNVLGLREPFPVATHDMAQARRTIKSLATLDFDHALPGHGRPVLGHASEKLATWSRAWLSD